MFYYTGINCSSLFENNSVVIETFHQIPFENLSKFEIGWNFSLLWRNFDLFISGKINKEEFKSTTEPVKIPNYSKRYKDATIDAECIYVLTEDDEIWKYKIFEKKWLQVPTFIHKVEESEQETIVQMLTTRCTLVLTNLGRVFAIPVLVDMPKRVKFIQIKSGFDHTILLTEDGQVYSMGMGTRGQLGHGDLEDHDDPKLIEFLAGLKVKQIAAGGWHSAVITDQGDLYTWGWNTNGELGFETDNVKICATPRVVDFKNENGEDIEVNIKKVECGNNFTICLTENDTIWGCGSNKYGQLGQPINDLKNSFNFIRLKHNLKNISDIKCREWGTCIITTSSDKE